MNLRHTLAALMIVGTAATCWADTGIDLPVREDGLRLLESSDEGFRLSLGFSRIDGAELETEHGDFSALFVPGFSHSTELGEPRLPVLRKIFSAPLGAQVSAELVSAESSELSLRELGLEYALLPAQPSLRKDQSPEDVPFAFDGPSYLREEFGDRPVVEVEELGILRGQRLFRLDLVPVAYNPVDHRLLVRNDLEIRVEFTGADLEATRELRMNTRSPYFEAAYRNMLVNYDDQPLRDDITSYPVKYLIVSDPMFTMQLEPFIEWKIQKGFEVIVGYIGDPDVGSTTTSIRQYIEDLYNDGTPESPAPSFVLFVGDENLVPAFSGDTGSHITDLHYVTMTGGDYLPEIYYGRFSARDTGQLQPQIDKTLEYERYEMPDPSFLGEAVMIAGMDGSYGSVWANGQINYGTTYYFNPAHGILSHTYLYPESGSHSQDIIDDVSNGVGYANYTAHGSSTSWADPSFTISDINGLQNDHEYPTVVGNCCLTNKFEVETCFGEAWLRAADKGAIGYIGGTNNTYWDEDYWWGVGAGSIVVNPTYEGSGPGAYDGMFHDHGEPFPEWYTTQASIIMAGNLAVVEGGGGNNYYWEIYALMGDPALSTYFSVPSANTVSYPDVIFLGQNSITITADPYSYVGLSQDGVLAAAALVDAGGLLVLEFDPFTVAGSADLVITRQNREPVIVSIPVTPNEGPYVTLQGYSPATAQYGESVGLDVTLENIGAADAVGVSGVLSIVDPYVTITDDSESFGDIPTGGTASVTDAYAVDLATVLPDQHLLRFDLEVSGTARDTWLSYLDLVVDAPDLSAGLAIVDDSAGGNGNGRLDPGESVELIVPVDNAGHAASPGGTATLGSTSGYVTITDGSDPIGPIAAGGSADANFTLDVSPDAPVGTPVDFAFDLDAGGYLVEDDFVYMVGLVLEDFESASFASFPWEMGGDADWLISGSPWEGAWCAQSGDVADYQASSLSVTLDVLSAGDISFYYKVSSEATYDFLYFYIDGAEQGGWSGEVGWTQASYAVSAGTHTFTWTYDKDYSVSDGSDCGWVDYIIFPAVGLPPTPSLTVDPTSIEATVEPGGTGETTLTLGNVGEGELSWSVQVSTDNPLAEIHPPLKLAKGEVDPRPGQGARDAGGPDSFGYSWMDSNEPGGPVFDWVELSGVGGDDSSLGPFDLGFTMSYYGNTYTQVRVCTNGFLSFTSSATNYTNDPIPGSSEPNNMIAPFWDDLNPNDGGTIWYWSDVLNGRFIVQWDGVPHYSGGGPETFEAILYADSRIVYQYQTVDTGTSSTVGIENSSGTDGLQVVYNSAYLANGLAIEFSTEELWLEVSPMSGTLFEGQTEPLTVSLDATDLVEGEYTGTITVYSNDPEHTVTDVPVTLTVGVASLDPPVIAATVVSCIPYISWEAVPGAGTYKVYEAEAQEGPYVLIEETPYLFYSLPGCPLPGTVRFYQVTAAAE